MANLTAKRAREWLVKLHKSRMDDRLLSPQGQFIRLKEDGYLMRNVVTGSVLPFDPMTWEGFGGLGCLM